MAFYSLTAFAPQPVGILTPRIVLDTGRNVFTAATNDIEGLLRILAAEGVKVVQVNKLDDFAEVTAADLRLPGE